MKKGANSLKYIKADNNDIDVILDIVQTSIKSIYPKYYPKEVVDFFSEFHCKDNIQKDVESGLVGILYVDGIAVGTGCYKDNHITRVYVKPCYQGNGYGSYIMNQLERFIGENYLVAVLDASLPASHLYEKRGYCTVEHCKYEVENGIILVYEVMEKSLVHNETKIDYDGKVFIPFVNSENGEVNCKTVFIYHQQGNEFSSEYTGGEVKKGFMIGKVNDNGELDFYYEHLNVNNEIRVGRCHSIPRINDEGKIELHETWQWLNGDCSSGESVVVER